MRQSNFIFGALAVAFVIFITTRGSLPAYLSVLFGTAKSSDNASATVAVAAEAKSSGTTAEQAFGFLQSGAIPGLKIPGLN